jgi:arylamine N-acetyltransferase
LQTIITQHLRTFHYENTPLFNAGKESVEDREVTPLQIDELFKFMASTNAGYCMQQLELMYAALSSAGFIVERHLAKSFIQPYSNFEVLDPDRDKSHEMLIVQLDGKRYIVDVGMGSLCLRVPLELQEGEVTVFDDHYRLTKHYDEWILDTKREEDAEWLCMYHFFNAPVAKDAVHAANKNLYLSAKHIRIRDDIFYFGITTPEKRKSLTWTVDKNMGVFKSVSRDGKEKPAKEFKTLDEMREFAREKFGFKK